MLASIDGHDDESGKSESTYDNKAGKAHGYSKGSDDYGSSSDAAATKSSKSSSTDHNSSKSNTYHMFHSSKSSSNGYGDETNDDYTRQLRRNLRAQ